MCVLGLGKYIDSHALRSIMTLLDFIFIPKFTETFQPKPDASLKPKNQPEKSLNKSLTYGLL